MDLTAEIAKWVLGLILCLGGIAYAYGVYSAAKTSIPMWSPDRVTALVISIAVAVAGLFILTH